MALQTDDFIRTNMQGSKSLLPYLFDKNDKLISKVYRSGLVFYRDPFLVFLYSIKQPLGCKPLRFR